MSTRITDERMSSDVTRHSAWSTDGVSWKVDWLPGRTIDRNQAVTAMALAEMVEDTPIEERGQSWLHFASFAGELDLTADEAIHMLLDRRGTCPGWE